MKLNWRVGVTDGLTESRRRRRGTVPGAQGIDSHADGKFLTNYGSVLLSASL